MKALIFDTETTGLLAKGAPIEYQPYIVQIAMLLAEDGSEVSAAKFLLNIGDVEMPTEAQAIHGISKQQSNRCGLPIGLVLDAFQAFLRVSDCAVAHNFAFDESVVDWELVRANRSRFWPKTYCTMIGSKSLCRIPGKYGDWKWPRLEEAYRHFFNEPFHGAHDALADVRAANRIFWELVKLGEVQ